MTASGLASDEAPASIRPQQLIDEMQLREPWDPDAKY